MEEIREVANAYKAGANDIEQLARDVFKSMDQNEDGKVSLCEFLPFMKERGYIQMSNEEWFQKLGKDKRESLGFLDVMTLCYIVKSGRPFCEGCGKFVSGVFFTCVQCFDRSCPDRSCVDCSLNCFSVCLQCYESKNFVHKHEEFLDNFTLLEAWRRKSQRPKLRATAAQYQSKDSHPQGSEEMKELRQIAMAYCRSTSEDRTEEEKIGNFFKSICKGRRVALHEFLEFMRQKAYEDLINHKLDLEFMNTPEFFKKLDRDKKGLDFSDVKTLYYIIQSGRPFCKGCGEFIRGVFFTCVSCFLRGSTCFSLCLHCYNAQKFIHSACTDHLFFDNYTLLETVRGTPRKGSKRRKNLLKELLGSTSSPGPIVPLNRKPNTSSPGSRVKGAKKATNREDIKVLESAANIAAATVTIASTFAAVCVIL